MNTQILEETLIAHPDVSEVCVVVMPAYEQNRRQVAFAAVKDGSVVTPASLLAYCRGALGEPCDTLSVVILDELPKSPTGAVQRRQLLELAKNKNAA